MMRCALQRSEGSRAQPRRLISEHNGGYGVSIMGNRGLVLDGNAGGTPTDNSGEPGAVLRLTFVAAGLLPAGVALRRGR
jgi:hypothetical protein